MRMIGYKNSWFLRHVEDAAAFLNIPTSNAGLSWLCLLEDMTKHRGILLSVSHDGVSLGFLKPRVWWWDYGLMPAAHTDATIIYSTWQYGWPGNTMPSLIRIRNVAPRVFYGNFLLINTFTFPSGFLLAFPRSSFLRQPGVCRLLGHPRGHTH